MNVKLFGLDDSVYGPRSLQGPFSRTLERQGRLYIYVGKRENVEEYREIPKPRDVTEELK